MADDSHAIPSTSSKLTMRVVTSFMRYWNYVKIVFNELSNFCVTFTGRITFKKTS